MSTTLARAGGSRPVAPALASTAASAAASATLVLSTRSAIMARVLAQLARYARQDHATILLEGESGTGKTVLARYIHGHSARASHSFREVSLASLDDALAASDLFGHLEGAFTDARRNRAGHFQSAHGGTLFLDEIGKASPAIQKKLLRVIETGELWSVGADRCIRVDVRLIAASNVPLAGLVDADAFLPDLYARLGCFRVSLPPLRKRREDIPGLVEHFVATHAPRCGYGDRVPPVDDELLVALTRAEWPYNIRQLDSTVHRLLVDAEGAEVLTLDHCVGDLEYLRALGSADDVGLTPEMVADVVCRQPSKAAAARVLGVSRMTVHRYLSSFEQALADQA